MVSLHNLGKHRGSVYISLTQLHSYSLSTTRSISQSRIMIRLFIVEVITDLDLVMMKIFQHIMSLSIAATIVVLTQRSQHILLKMMEMGRMALLGSMEVTSMLLRSSASRWSSCLQSETWPDPSGRLRESEPSINRFRTVHVQRGCPPKEDVQCHHRPSSDNRHRDDTANGHKRQTSESETKNETGAESTAEVAGGYSGDRTEGEA